MKTSSFSHAIAGIKTAFRYEKNFRIQSVIAVLVLLGAIGFNVTSTECLILILTITLVLVLEVINSMLERLLDLVKPRMHGYVKEMKDIMAGGVLIASIASVMIGIIIFTPYIITFFALIL